MNTFRGKSQTGEWKYGYYFFSTQRDQHVIVTTFCKIDIQTPVFAESIGAAVGLKYKSGRDAYVGDLLKDEKDNLYRIWEVKGGFCINVSSFPKDIKMDYPFPLQPLADEQTVSWFESNCEYVGNVFENPEMLCV